MNNPKRYPVHVTCTQLCTPVMLLFLCCLACYGQNENIAKKLGTIEMQQIEGGLCSKYDFLANTKGKIAIIEFWETWCAPCIKGMEHLRVLKNKFPDLLKVVCVSSDSFDKTVDFIAKGNFPFDFIYDSASSLSTVFLHSGIPHSILIDKQGIIQSATYPGFITETVLEALNSDIQVDLPGVTNFNPAEIKNSQGENSMFKFFLQRHKLGERDYLGTTCSRNLPVRIITGYEGHAFKDTVETINECVIAGKSALQIYQYAYNNMPLTRFIYDKNLSYLNSRQPNFIYSINFSCSNLLGDYKEVLINQLNSLWQLTTQVVEKKVTYYELSEIGIKKDTIVAMPDSTVKTSGTTYHTSKQLNVSNALTAEAIASLLENQLVFVQNDRYWNDNGNKVYYPVVTHIAGEFALTISINDESLNVDNWIALLAKNGLKLVKKKGKIRFIKVYRQPVVRH